MSGQYQLCLTYLPEPNADECGLSIPMCSVYPTSDQCVISTRTVDLEVPIANITTGVCSDKTVEQLSTKECSRYYISQPHYIQSALSNLVWGMCRQDQYPWSRTDQQNMFRKSTDRIAPIGLVMELDDGTIFTNLNSGKA